MLTVGVALDACCGVGALTFVATFVVVAVPRIVFAVDVVVGAWTAGGVVDDFAVGVAAAGVVSFGGDT